MTANLLLVAGRSCPFDGHRFLCRRNFYSFRSRIPVRLAIGESLMPKVGGKHYAYTKKGQAKAKAAAKATGKKVSHKKPKKY